MRKKRKTGDGQEAIAATPRTSLVSLPISPAAGEEAQTLVIRTKYSREGRQRDFLPISPDRIRVQHHRDSARRRLDRNCDAVREDEDDMNCDAVRGAMVIPNPFASPELKEKVSQHISSAASKVV